MNKKIVSLVSILVLIVGCGSIENPFTTPEATQTKSSQAVGTAFYVDSAVEGVTV